MILQNYWLKKLPNVSSFKQGFLGICLGHLWTIFIFCSFSSLFPRRLCRRIWLTFHALTWLQLFPFLFLLWAISFSCQKQQFELKYLTKDCSTAKNITDNKYSKESAECSKETRFWICFAIIILKTQNTLIRCF